MINMGGRREDKSAAPAPGGGEGRGGESATREGRQGCTDVLLQRLPTQDRGSASPPAAAALLRCVNLDVS